MSYNLYMLGIAVATLFSWSGFGLVITKLSPCFKWLDEGLCTLSNNKGLLAFYITLFLALTGTFTIIGFYLRVYLKRNEVYYDNINVAFRQGLLLAFAICGLLALQGIRVLTWWDSLILMLILFLVEFSFTARSSNHQ